MTIEITQHLNFEGDNFPYSWSKQYESDIKPLIGECIEDSIWKDPYEYNVVEVRNNYNEDIVYVEVEMLAYPLPAGSKDEMAQMANSHGWTASWQR